MDWQQWFQASTTVCRHSIHFRSDRCGQIHTVEPSEKASIGGANPRCQSRAEQIGITEIKVEKGAILSQTLMVLISAAGECLPPCIIFKARTSTQSGQSRTIPWGAHKCDHKTFESY
jgi:hypothetical protein